MARRPNDPQRRERILQATLDTIATHGFTRSPIVNCQLRGGSARLADLLFQRY